MGLLVEPTSEVEQLQATGSAAAGEPLQHQQTAGQADKCRSMTSALQQLDMR